MKTFWELREELKETTEVTERISGSGTDRKAVLKRAFRSGQHSTDRFYGRDRTSSIPAPKGMRKTGDYMSKHADKGIEKAYNAGKHDDDRIGSSKGREKMKPQDSLKGTEHGRSMPSSTGKIHYKTQTHSNKMAAISNRKNKLPK